MSTARPDGPTSIQELATDKPSEAAFPTTLSSQIDLLVSLYLFSWPALTLSITNAFTGSPQVSADKREWLVGAISELISPADGKAQLYDVGDLEEVLLQVMIDEFEVVVDDGSAEEVASNIWAGVEKLKKGDPDGSGLPQLYQKWLEKQRNGSTGKMEVQIVRGKDEDGEETDWDDEEDDEWDGLEDEKIHRDVEMGEAPLLVETKKEKATQEVDEDGFTKVVSKKKR